MSSVLRSTTSGPMCTWVSSAPRSSSLARPDGTGSLIESLLPLAFQHCIRILSTILSQVCHRIEEAGGGMSESSPGADATQVARPESGAGSARTVRDAVLDVMREHDMTTIFGNPGSTEIPFLTDLPGDFEFVLGLHEGALVGIASGYAIGRGRPAFVNLHTAPGLGNAVNAIAGARDNRAPLVIVVGQQDRRQLAFEPFLTGRALERLAGEYPVWANAPVRAQ